MTLIFTSCDGKFNYYLKLINFFLLPHFAFARPKSKKKINSSTFLQNKINAVVEKKIKFFDSEFI